jgi:putative PIN family toxin of toxin-antitoxin system
MRVVLDTNVIVSAFLSPTGSPATVLRLVLQRDLDVYVNTAILVEYEQVLSRPKFSDQIAQSTIRRFFDILNDIGLKVNTRPSRIRMADETDRVFYDLAKAADAILITGNKKHYPKEPFIKNPTEFISAY